MDSPAAMEASTMDASGLSDPGVASIPAADSVTEPAQDNTIETQSSENNNINEATQPASRAISAAAPGVNGTPPPPSFGMPQLSASTEEILQRVAARNAGFNPGTPSYEAAKQQVLKNMRTSDSIQVVSAGAASTAASVTPARKGRGGGRAGGTLVAKADEVNAMGLLAPMAARRGSGRGRGTGRVGRPKGGKRKRGSDDGDEVYCPIQIRLCGRRSLNANC